MKKYILAASALFAATPAFAQNNSAFTSLTGAVTYVSSWVNTLIALIVALSVLMFIWGVFRYVRGADDPAKQKDAKWFVLYGILGIFIMLSVWGLVGILQGTFGTSQTIEESGVRIPDVPTVNTPR